MSNPLLKAFDTPHAAVPFELIKEEHFIPALNEAIKVGKNEIAAITENEEAPTFKNTIEALERSGEFVERVASILFNLNSSETNDKIQEITKEASPLLTDFSNDITLNQALFEKIKRVYDAKATLELNIEETKLLENTYKGFSRNGANLSDKDKEALREVDKKKSAATLQFSENVLNETNDYTMHLTDEADLAGLPETAIEMAKMTAKEKELDGWIFTLQYPSYQPFMTYADNRDLRQKLYIAFGTKASKGNDNDNKALVQEIVHLRHQRAQLLGYDNHADFVLEERMAGSAQRVNEFLSDILTHAKPVALKQIEEVLAYAKANGFEEDELQRWDLSYYSEKLKKEKYEIDDEMLRPYFKLENVVDGVFEIAKRLYGLSFKENKDIPVYHPDVTAYEVTDETGRFISVFYADYFPREGKRGGAWMTSFREQYKIGDKDIRPLVSIVCNFSKPTDTKPSLLSFGEVTTLFHEFGHALHGMLADGVYQSLAGTNVYWDFVELPSQILENWCFEKEALDIFARHYETNEAIPQDLILRIKKSSNFLEGYSTMRQLSFGLLDMAWYGKAHTAEEIKDVFAFEKEAYGRTELFPMVEGTNMSCQFGHIFAGGYSAGYYSYKWAEVLDADAFELFQEKGIFNKEVAQAFRDNILSKGGTEHPMELYKRFRGQEPSVKALLKRAGLLEDNA